MSDPAADAIVLCYRCGQVIRTGDPALLALYELCETCRKSLGELPGVATPPRPAVWPQRTEE